MVLRVVGDDFLSRWALTLKEDTSFNDFVRYIYPKHVILTTDMKDYLMSAIFLNWTSSSKGIIISATKLAAQRSKWLGVQLESGLITQTHHRCHLLPGPRQDSSAEEVEGG
ncbi:uncharacterized protein FFB20_08984 [Fusarium fujikuroi]|uniref:Uncharacterized protein n=2 Tax=Fusarium fujikuroi TaxID=5127 RepID=S0DNZ1_GIBF5|nr:uncharacterized protein FFUJ_01158 [Fusarium fujikuroi IMI 58289]KLP04922.1 uncharacterized protein Y057_5696 [Fusarium fujikuroi]KLP20772.1 uncharacterized protein LW94_9800 [Fusarium fujikuroi]CCT62303.1 uncharacterized protein FFUJ_01158 [Fusarium fujikuroi IMI 58289]SCN67798.1 uncharacterized protein FFE2_01239 [Fusarium fujikuroi]SCN71446.1 uncharacterized protein FFC1_01235 [Fusarium fujikuroi]